jgi:1-deoxy-D-xylulose-5-phosphate synthase
MPPRAYRYAVPRELFLRHGVRRYGFHGTSHAFVARGAAALLEEHDLSVTVADARFAKPLDAELLATLAAEHELIVTIEDGVVQGGFGSAVAEHLMDRDLGGEVRLLRVGLPDRYVTHGKPALLHAEVGLTPEAVVERVLEFVGSGSSVLLS